MALFDLRTGSTEVLESDAAGTNTLATDIANAVLLEVNQDSAVDQVLNLDELGPILEVYPHLETEAFLELVVNVVQLSVLGESEGVIFPAWILTDFDWPGLEVTGESDPWTLSELDMRFIQYVDVSVEGSSSSEADVTLGEATEIYLSVTKEATSEGNIVLDYKVGLEVSKASTVEFSLPLAAALSIEKESYSLGELILTTAGTCAVEESSTSSFYAEMDYLVPLEIGTAPTFSEKSIILSSYVSMGLDQAAQSETDCDVFVITAIGFQNHAETEAELNLAWNIPVSVSSSSYTSSIVDFRTAFQLSSTNSIQIDQSIILHEEIPLEISATSLVERYIDVIHYLPMDVSFNVDISNQITINTATLISMDASSSSTAYSEIITGSPLRIQEVSDATAYADLADNQILRLDHSSSVDSYLETSAMHPMIVSQETAIVFTLGFTGALSIDASAYTSVEANFMSTQQISFYAEISSLYEADLRRMENLEVVGSSSSQKDITMSTGKIFATDIESAATHAIEIDYQIQLKLSEAADSESDIDLLVRVPLSVSEESYSTSLLKIGTPFSIEASSLTGAEIAISFPLELSGEVSTESYMDLDYWMALIVEEEAESVDQINLAVPVELILDYEVKAVYDIYIEVPVLGVIEFPNIRIYNPYKLN